MAMLQRVNRRSRSSRFLADSDVLPQTLDVVKNRASHLGIECACGQAEQLIEDGEYFGVLLQYPGVNGELRDYGELIALAQQRGALVVVAVDLMSLVLLK